MFKNFDYSVFNKELPNKVEMWFLKARFVSQNIN